MKRIILVITASLFALLVLFSCQKEDKASTYTFVDKFGIYDDLHIGYLWYQSSQHSPYPGFDISDSFEVQIDEYDSQSRIIGSNIINTPQKDVSYTFKANAHTEFVVVCIRYDRNSLYFPYIIYLTKGEDTPLIFTDVASMSYKNPMESQ